MITLEDNWCEEGRNCFAWFLAMGCIIERVGDGKGWDGAEYFHATFEKPRMFSIFHDYEGDDGGRWFTLDAIVVKNATGNRFFAGRNANADYIWHLINKGLIRIDA